MSETPISILQRAVDLGIKLSIQQVGALTVNALTVETSKAWPKEFAELLRDCKPRLIALLELPFVMVYSQAVNDTLFFCEDDQTRTALIDAGGDSFAIHTKAELHVLVEQNRVAPFTNAELCKLHEIKKTFKAKITEQTLPRRDRELDDKLDRDVLRERISGE